MTQALVASRERIRSMRPGAWLCLLVGIPLIANGWHWHFIIAGLILAAASVGLFLGKAFALHAALWCGRACLLLVVPFDLWPDLRLGVWNMPPDLLRFWLGTDRLPAALLLGVTILLEVTRHRLRPPLSPCWCTAALTVGVLATGLRFLPALYARSQIDPVAWEHARRLIQAMEEDPLLFRTPEWWNDEPWKGLEKTPAWQRPVMRCTWYSPSGDGLSIGDSGIGSWFRHPRAGQAPGIVDYRFRDGSRWRGAEVTRYLKRRKRTKDKRTVPLKGFDCASALPVLDCPRHETRTLDHQAEAGVP